MWRPEQQRTFDCLRARIASIEVMKCLDLSLETELIVDAHPVGPGAILAQVTDDEGTTIIAYASCLLTDCESRYSH